MKRYWADFTAHDFARLGRQNLVAVLPVAAIEQHGPHLPLSTDRDILEGLIAHTVDRLPAALPAAFLPILAVGKSDEHARYAGTLSLSAATLGAVIADIGSSVARAGVRKLVILNSHGGNVPVLDIAARDLRIRHDMVAVAAGWFALGLPDGVIGEAERLHGIHAGEMETALMLALRPDLVRMERARDFDSLGLRLERNFRHLGLGARGRLGWQAQDLNPAGAVGNAAAANADTGRRILDHVSVALAELVEDVYRLPVSLLHNPTEV